MICRKHHIQCPCLICAREEYELYKDTPGHDFTQVLKLLRENNAI